MTQEIMECRICSSRELEDVFDLGEQPLANGLLASPGIGEKYPLVLTKCIGGCGHVQLKHTVEPTAMFEDYHFHTASSERMVNHFCQLLLDNTPKSGGVVVEIGSNDGAVLQRYKQKLFDGVLDNYLDPEWDFAVWGIDPSENLCNEAANSRNVDVWCDFFNENTAKEFVSAVGQASLIMCCNVLGHVHDLNSFVQGLALLLADDGKIVIEVPDVYQMVEHLAFDTIYHEHISYFSATSMARLFNQNCLYIQEITPQDVHGGTLRYTITKRVGNSNSVYDRINTEYLMPINWETFKTKVATQKAQLQFHLTQCKKEGRKVAGYGAAAKTTVRLNYFEIDNNLLPVVADCTKDKQGLFIPGTFQLVISPEELQLPANFPHIVVIFAWNHAKEIVKKEHTLVEKGVIFVTPDFLPVLQ